MLDILGHILIGVRHTPNELRSRESDLVLAKILEDHARYVRGELSELESIALWKTTVAYAETMREICVVAARDAR